MKNKVEAQPRNANKKNHVVEPIRNVDVKQSQLNANSEPLCATCKKSMFDGVHDLCILDFVKNMNSRAKFAKKHKKQNIWKPTSHVFTEVGFKWKPTGRTFTIVGNSYPLTRITSANVVPPKKTTSHSVETQKPELKVYSRKPKSVKNVGSSKNVKIVESKNAKHSKPNHTWRSNTTDISSSSSLVMTSCPDCFLVSGLWMFKTHDREPLSAHELCNLFPPLDNPELTIRRRSRADPTLLNDFEMTAEGNSDPPVPDHQTMEELCQPSLNGDDGNKHLDKFLHVTQSIKVNGVTDDALHLYLFPHSLSHHATAWFDHLPRNSINTFEQMAKIFLRKYFPPFMVTPTFVNVPMNHYSKHGNVTSFQLIDVLTTTCGTFMKKHPEECYDLIENMIAHHNDWDTSSQRSESSSSVTSSFDTEIVTLKAEMAKINKNLMRVFQVNQQVKVVTPNYETCGGPHSYTDCPTTVGQTQNFIKMNTASSSGSRTLSSNTITNLKEDLKGITTRSGTAYQGPTIPTTSSLPQVVERKTEVTKDTVHPTNNKSTKDVQPPVVQAKTTTLNFEPIVAPIIEPVVAPVSALKPNLKPSIPYPSRLNDQKLRDKAND
uniref:Reverse transcriptase domain-containing protein n=1 Tax=Tanacetum cinerariifolium TaxID=118510 RepID=A0A6L2KTA8_TANCI|nr:reverse transcriptase domain-containing protein [Tanacetum cinerariifolium]